MSMSDNMSARYDSLQVEDDEATFQDMLRQSRKHTGRPLHTSQPDSTRIVPASFSSGDASLPSQEAREDGVISDNSFPPPQSWSISRQNPPTYVNPQDTYNKQDGNNDGTMYYDLGDLRGPDSTKYHQTFMSGMAGTPPDIMDNDRAMTPIHPQPSSAGVEDPKSQPDTAFRLIDITTEDVSRSRAIGRRLPKLYEYHVQTYGPDFSRWPTCGTASMTKYDMGSIPFHPRDGRSWSDFIDTKNVDLTVSEDGSRADLSSKLPRGVLIYSLVTGKSDRNRKKGHLHPGANSVRCITSIPFGQFCNTSLKEGKYLPVLLCQTSPEILKKMYEVSGSGSSHAAAIRPHTPLATEYSKSRRRTQCEDCGDFYRQPKHKVDQDANSKCNLSENAEEG